MSPATIDFTKGTLPSEGKQQESSSREGDYGKPHKGRLPRRCRGCGPTSPSSGPIEARVLDHSSDHNEKHRTTLGPLPEHIACHIARSDEATAHTH